LGLEPSGPRTGIRSYLQLLRPANVVTAVADVLAGYAIAGPDGASGLTWLMISTACLYGGGVVLNDFFDRTVDAIERPERPIPSGRVPARAAAFLGGALLVAGVAAAGAATSSAQAVAAAIAIAVLAYDSWTKRHAVAGPLTMGTCRGLNLCLGMAAVSGGLAGQWVLGALPFVYISSITAISRGEVHGGGRRAAGLALAGVAAVVGALIVLAAGGGWSSLIFTALLAWRVLPALSRAYRRPEPIAIRQAVKAGVLSLVVLDAALAALYAGAVHGLAVLALAVVAFGLSRLFAVT
jgi:4-hydroxybenzoate polyprenyltransferase